MGRFASSETAQSVNLSNWPDRHPGVDAVDDDDDDDDGMLFWGRFVPVKVKAARATVAMTHISRVLYVER
eukprot:6891623-Ditylum_brightwellii.AAC.1